MVPMAKLNARLVGVELYFDDLPAAKRCDQETLVSVPQPARRA